MYKKVKVFRVSLEALSDTFTVILMDEEGTSILPIRIGHFEASSIALALQGVSFERPLTHDLMINILNLLGVKLIKVIIDDLRNDIYYAKLILRRGNELFEVDSRPSDSIALALRADAPIYVAESLMTPIPKELKLTEEELYEHSGRSSEASPKSLLEEEFSVRELPLTEEDEEKIRFREFLEKLKPSDFLKDMESESFSTDVDDDGDKEDES